MTRAATKYGRKKRTTCPLHEDVRSAALSVDREAGVIKGVKILGTDSVNGRRYTSEAIAAATHLYEGRLVNVDHPTKGPTQSRSALDRLGRLVNVHAQGDGLYGDLEVLLSHPMAQRVMEAAERMPEAFGLSHNATGQGVTIDGVFVVEEITEVRSVDLVADPATTKSLSESRETVIAKKLPKGKEERQAAVKKALLEMGYDMEAADPGVDAEPDGEDELTHLFNAFRAMKDKDPEKANKILAMLKAEVEGDEPESTEESTDEPPCPSGKKDDDKEKKKAEEGRKRKASKDPAVKELQEELAGMRLKEWIGEQCAARDVLLDKTLLESLTSLADRKKIEAHLDWLKGRMVKTKVSAPRSGSARNIPESRTAAPKDAKEFAGALFTI